MKKTKILTVALLLATLAGCSKDNDGRIRIFAEKMRNNTKVLVNPEEISAGAQWVTGEKIRLNGTSTYQIVGIDGNFYLEGTDDPSIIAGDKVAYYPGESSNNKYDIAFDDDTMFINSLSVIFHSDGQHEMAFPMVATAGSNEKQLGFRHLTGGFRVALKNTSSSSVSVARVRVIAQNTGAVEPLYYQDNNNRYYAKWAAPMGPSMPLDDNLDVKYCSVMNFDLYNEDNSNVSFSQNVPRKFCIPITVSSVKNLYVTGYDNQGTELFSVKKEFTTAVTVDRNHMYDIPTIEF